MSGITAGSGEVVRLGENVCVVYISMSNASKAWQSTLVGTFPSVPTFPKVGTKIKTRMERDIFGDEAVDDALPSEFESMSAEGIGQRARLLENELRVLKDESTRLTLETNNLKEKIKENKVSERA